MIPSKASKYHQGQTYLQAYCNLAINKGFQNQTVWSPSGRQAQRGEGSPKCPTQAFPLHTGASLLGLCSWGLGACPPPEKQHLQGLLTFTRTGKDRNSIRPHAQPQLMLSSPDGKDPTATAGDGAAEQNPGSVNRTARSTCSMQLES